MRLEDLDYTLPPERIAQHPPARREDARLLVVDRVRGDLKDRRIPDLCDWLRAGDVLALNETRVRPARLSARRTPSGGKVELLFVRPLASLPGGGETWRVLARPARRARVGERLESPGGGLVVEVIGDGPAGERSVRIVSGQLAETLEREGTVPLPPYLHRPPSPEDRDRYQTVYARVEGAVAAPTAGLHLGEEVLAALASRGIRTARVLLHVGPGTFRAVTGDPHQHVMDEEYFEVSPEAADTLSGARADGGRIVAVGTTAVRALESAYDLNRGRLGPAAGWTRKFIQPPYEFRGVDILLTNFHLPRTTLLLLVAAFAGEDRVRRAYAHAIEQGYRFYSYGDAMLVV